MRRHRGEKRRRQAGRQTVPASRHRLNAQCNRQGGGHQDADEQAAAHSFHQQAAHDDETEQRQQPRQVGDVADVRPGNPEPLAAPG